MNEQLALLPGYLTAHLQLALAALLLGVLISVPLGVLVSRTPLAGAAGAGRGGVVQTVPGLALLAVMVPLLALAGLPSIGFLPAFIGLVLYSLLPILRNTVTGLAGVDPAYLEAARGVGMTPGQQLRRVELPLAMPVIIAGIRTATVWTVGTATLSTPVGATEPRQLHLQRPPDPQPHGRAGGLRRLRAAGAGAGRTGPARGRRLVAPPPRRARAWRSARSSLLYVYAGVTLGREVVRGADRGRIAIGAKTFTEQYILSEILAGQIRHATGARRRTSSSHSGSTVAFDALRRGRHRPLRGVLRHDLGHADEARRNPAEPARGARRRRRAS